MRIADDVYMLELEYDGRTYHPALINCPGGQLLIDSALPMLCGQLISEIGENGFDAANIGELIITHQDFDHIGCLKELKRSFPHISLLCHEAEAKYISGEVKHIKISDLEKRADTLIGDESAWLKQLRSNAEKYCLPADGVLADGQLLPYCGGIEVIYTPGHTPGHICLYLKRSRLLIAGDALNADKGQLLGPSPKFSHDMDMAIGSVKKLASRDIAQIICFHGGLVTNNIRESLENIIEEYSK